jgi:hypothetical protein
LSKTLLVSELIQGQGNDLRGRIVVQTDGLPPYQGRMYFAMIGCTWNSKKALKKMVTP